MLEAIEKVLAAVTINGGEAMIAALLGGGGLAAWTAYKKLPAERDSVIVGYQRTIIEDQQRTLDRQSAQIRTLEQALTRRDQRIDRQQKELTEVHDLVRELRGRVAQLEAT